jgi:hypothetical protein
MILTAALLASGYVFNDEDYDDCYVKQDANGFIHCYQKGEDEGEWNYVRMTDEFDVLVEKTFTE